MYANSGMIKFAKDAVRQVRTATQNEIGEDVEVWTDGDTIKVLVLPLTGRNIRDMAGVTDTSTHIAFSLSNLTCNERLAQTGANYLVQHVEDWISHKQAILEMVK